MIFFDPKQDNFYACACISLEMISLPFFSCENKIFMLSILLHKKLIYYAFSLSFSIRFEFPNTLRAECIIYA